MNDMPAEHVLAGRCVLITGGAKRLGAATARKLHGAGANIVVHFSGSRTGAEQTVSAARAGACHRERATPVAVITAS